MFDTNISEAILHNDFLVDFSNKRLHPQHLHSPKVIASLPQKKIRPQTTQKEISSNPNHGKSVGRWGARWYRDSLIR